MEEDKEARKQKQKINKILTELSDYYLFNLALDRHDPDGSYWYNINIHIYYRFKCDISPPSKSKPFPTSSALMTFHCVKEDIFFTFENESLVHKWGTGTLTKSKFDVMIKKNDC